MDTDQKTLPQWVQTEPDDAQLIKRFQRGDKSAFDTLMIRHQEPIYRLVCRYVKNPEDALDLTQDAFFKAYQGLCQFMRASQFYTWLYRITVNLCIDFNRRREKQSVVVDALEPDDVLVSYMANAHFPRPSKVAENEELLLQIRQAMARLTPMQRETFILRYHEGLSLKAIAHKLGRKTGTIKSHLFFARERLQHELRPYLRCEANED
ncbi:MAG: sigma-70 family RNA polymerase sigma factor [Candidatus Poribacteria bacterium]|nr:sigma-70 family RNA polymerase sigma factor [Candidatus Poribacteria bacterium]